MKSTTWVQRKNGLCDIALDHDLRLRRIEKRLFEKRIRMIGMPTFCDAPRCKKKPEFQCGKNFEGNIGSWCSQKHFENYAI